MTTGVSRVDVSGQRESESRSKSKRDPLASHLFVSSPSQLDLQEHGRLQTSPETWGYSLR